MAAEQEGDFRADAQLDLPLPTLSSPLDLAAAFLLPYLLFFILAWEESWKINRVIWEEQKYNA